MIRCGVCGEQIKPTKEDVYLVPVSVLNFGSQYYECTDCPRCSCQVVLNTRYGEKRKIEHTKREDAEPSKPQWQESLMKNFLRKE